MEVRKTMNKDQFNSLELEKQIETFNQALAETGTIRKACDSLGVSKTTIRDRFKKINYYFDAEANKYIFKADAGEDHEVIHEEKKPEVVKQEKKIPENNLKEVKEEIQGIKGEIQGIKDQMQSILYGTDLIELSQGSLAEARKLQTELGELLEAKDQILNLIKNFNRQPQAQAPANQAFDVRNLKCGLSTKTVKIYDDILDQMADYMQENSNMKQQDIFNQALYEFLNK